MRMDCYTKLRPMLFALPPEKAHRAAVRMLQFGLGPQAQFTHPSLNTIVAGMKLPNPVGLAAGFDKNAECFAGSLRAGFGFVEIGTVTPRAQPGNTTPRLFRLVEQEAVINRLGFNNEGMEAAARRLAQHQGPGVIGGNVGKNKDSSDALADYVSAMRALYPYVDYITANISSPNTPGLRALQAKDELHALIVGLQTSRDTLVGEGQAHKPIFVKIAPDNDDAALDAIATTALATKLDGLIVSNTTIARDAVKGAPHGNEQGGLSGKPLFAPSTQVLRTMYALTQGAIPLIGVGGIASGADAYAKILAGASAVQLYSALVYQGFSLAERINRELAALLARDGFAHVTDAVGKEIRP